MNLKDRLENIKTTNIISIKDDYFGDNFYDVQEIFADSKEIRTIISETINAGKNIVFIAEPYIDKILIAKYFKFLMAYKSEDVIISNNLTEEMLSSDLRVNIIPTPNMKDVVKILEYIMYGYKSFSFGMNFVGSNNTINKLKTAIEINNKNMQEESIETLLASSNLVFVYFDKNIDGLFYISKIEKLVADSSSVDVVTILDLHVEKVNQKKARKLKNKKLDKKDTEIQQEEDITVEQEPNSTETQVEISDTKEEKVEESLEERTKKINKCKKLKEKFKNKKAKLSE